MPDVIGINKKMEAAAKSERWDMLWIDKGRLVTTATLEGFRKDNPNCLIVGYSPDDMNSRPNQSRQFLEHLPLYDYFLTTKSYNVAELTKLGARNVVFIGNGYDAKSFRPLTPSADDRRRLGGGVGFIGSFEPARAASMAKIAAAGIPVRVWGDGWQRFGSTPKLMQVENKRLLGDDFALACCSFKINLGFLRKVNRDLQTTRSVEIPGCGAFMLAERTDEHLDLFDEGAEAEFFGSDDELIQKCQYYLEHEDDRRRIAKAGLNRCESSGYDNDSRMNQIFDLVFASGRVKTETTS
ncbi:CgeB family protein [Rubripirellula tenax]|nr:glycosyltransferase [Rubripirellula tenax]